MLPILATLLPLINKFIPDKDKQKELTVSIEKEFTKQMEMQKEIISAEIKLGGVTAKWRPYTAICFVAILVIHWLMYDVLTFFLILFDADVHVTIPVDKGYTSGLLEVVKLCLGGYIFSRSAEKGIKLWRKE